MLKWLPVVLVLAQAVACQESLPSSFVETVESRVPLAAGVAAQTTRTAPLTIEFDLPPEFWNRKPDGTYSITGIRIGLFRRDNQNVLLTTELSRDSIAVGGATGRVTLPAQELPVSESEVVLRVQSLSGTRASEWSAATPLVAAVGSPAPPTRRAARPRRRVAPSDVSQHPLLEQELRKVLPPEARIEEVVKSFRRIEDVAVAVVISRDHKIPFTAIADVLERSPGLSLQGAVRQIRPTWGPRAAMPKARADARQLVRPQPSRSAPN